MMKRRIFAGILALILMFSAAGCDTASEPMQFGQTTKETGGQEAEGSFAPFEDVWRADVDYSELEYEHYELEWFDAYTEPIYNMAENGGGARLMREADYALIEELNYVFTLMAVAELKYMADPANQELSDELTHIQQVFELVWEEYWEAMHVLSLSEHSDLLEPLYHETIIGWFEEYIPYTDEEKEQLAYSEEEQLIQEYYELMAEEEPDEAAVGEVFLELTELRREQAEVYGYENYADYAYESIYYRDYTPEQVQTIWQNVKDWLVPLKRTYAGLAAKQEEKLYEADDLDCSPETILGVMEKVLPELSPQLYHAYEYMVEHNLYDIDYDPDKADTGYTVRLYSVNEPFIFNAAYDEYFDYTDMFHEFGHFVNMFYTQSDLLFGVSDNDLSELQSQGMEMLFVHYYDEIFGETYAKMVQDCVLMDMVYSIVDGAMFDEFQQRVFALEEVTLEQVNQIYAQLYLEYGYEEYDGYETEWMWVPHNFEYPFYYISYGISALGALELYEMSQSSWDRAVEKYLEICAADTEVYYYSEILNEFRLKDVFAGESYKQTAEMLEEEFGPVRGELDRDTGHRDGVTVQPAP